MRLFFSWLLTSASYITEVEGFSFPLKTTDPAFTFFPVMIVMSDEQRRKSCGKALNVSEKLTGGKRGGEK